MFTAVISESAPMDNSLEFVFIVTSAVFVMNTLVERPTQSLAGLGFLALGVPVYWLTKRSKQIS